MERVYHPYEKWEDYLAGMWNNSGVKDPDYMLQKAIKFTGNAKKYGSYMQRVTKEWPIACQHNLTNASQNRKAWIGHAASCLALGCPEAITRKAWAYLSQKQQDAANKEADQAISEWEERIYARMQYGLFGDEEKN